jgi:hypothetical protein
MVFKIAHHLKGFCMQDDTESNQKLQAIHAQLRAINQNLLKVFWIVGFFAFLYFGLMIYLMFYR